MKQKHQQVISEGEAILQAIRNVLGCHLIAGRVIRRANGRKIRNRSQQHQNQRPAGSAQLATFLIIDYQNGNQGNEKTEDLGDGGYFVKPDYRQQGRH